MKKNWFHQLLLSYLPVFLITTSVIILLFFLTLSELSMQETRNVNKVQSQALMDAVDQNLLTVERSIIKDVMGNPQVESFFQHRTENDYLGEQQVAQIIRDIGAYLPDVDSIVLYRKSDHTILTAHEKLLLEDHPDRSFLEHAEQEGGKRWSGPRTLQVDQGSTQQVVTMVKRMNPPAGDEGLIIFNVKLSGLEFIFEDTFRSKLNYARLLNSEGIEMFRSSPDDSGRIVSEIVSEYTGWKLLGGFRERWAYGFFSALNGVWILFAFLTLSAGIVWIIYVSRRNYKPVELIINRLQQSAMLRRQWSSGENQFAIIESAIDSLVDQAVKLEKQNDEMSEYRTRHYFKEWLEGNFAANDSALMLELERLHIPPNAGEYAAAVLEIDNYYEFVSLYHARDQLLLKYIVTSVVKELAQQENVQVWAEWIDNQRLGLLLVRSRSDSSDAESSLKRSMLQLANKTIAWLIGNVSFTVTMGIGPVITDLAEAPESYEDAAKALSYKSVLGSNRVLTLDELQLEQHQPDYVQSLTYARQLSEFIRLGEERWVNYFELLFQQLENDKPSTADLSRLLHYLIYQLQNEISELPGEVQQVWTQEAMPRLNEGMKRFETLTELKPYFLSVLAGTIEAIGKLRQTRTHHPLVVEVKAWIGERYVDPDFSLMAVSEKFNLHPNYVSRLFKEEFGEKFIDYVTKVRMEKAKELLLGTKVPIQDIALQVGYTRPLSFIRVFKKIVGITPGEYRKAP